MNPKLEEALERLADTMNIGESREIARVAADAKRRARQARRKAVRSASFYTRHTVSEARAAALEAERRYP